MKNEFEVNGYIEVPIDISEEEFSKEFLSFIESKGWSFIGIINDTSDNKYTKPDKHNKK